jgi:hypothetical protein
MTLHFCGDKVKELKYIRFTHTPCSVLFPHSAVGLPFHIGVQITKSGTSLEKGNSVPYRYW